MAIPTPEKRIAEFENFGFGLFIHYGLYSQLGRGEWVLYIEKLNLPEYEKLAQTFTASKFDARKIVSMAKAAGVKYITLTTRHHEGFSLYDTHGLNTFDAPHTPCGRDLIREFVDACHEFDVVPFFYHTTLDWRDYKYKHDFKAYLQYLRDSVEVLCTRYGKIGGFWFDGNWAKKNHDWEEDALYGVIRKHQPDAIIVNNTGTSSRGEAGHPELDSVTFEQGRPTPMDREGMSKYYAAEMCHTMNGHWGYGHSDLHYKSLAELIETFCACRKVGANYLLNVGPTGEGEIPLMQEALLRGIGEWISKTGNAIYEGKPCGVLGQGKNFALKCGNKLYFYVHDLSITGDSNVTIEHGGAGEKTFTGVKETIKSIRWTDRDETLSFVQDGETLKINCTGFPYGSDLVVRVAEAEIEE